MQQPTGKVQKMCFGWCFGPHSWYGLLQESAVSPVHRAGLFQGSYAIGYYPHLSATISAHVVQHCHIAGTYSIDATHVGNHARNLNHSCDPNCFTRTLVIRHADDGHVEEHVLILAKRDIKPGEELTYDYRLGGFQQRSDCHSNCTWVRKC